MTVSRVLLTTVALLVVVLAGCSGDADRATGEGAASPLSGGRVSTPDALFDSADDPVDEAAAEQEDDADHEVAEEKPEDPGAAGPGFTGSQGEGPALPEQVATRSGERVIKDGTMTIEVGEGQFLAAYRRVIETALDLGGHMTDSTSASTDGGGTSGSVTVRVPVERYEELLTRVGRVGSLRSQEISSRDVTAEFTDIESRLRHLRAQEAFYLELLEEAASVQDAITVKHHLDDIQAQIEQARGRLNVLEDRTSYSTLTVEIIEPGTEPVVAAVGGRPTLTDYWDTARGGFVTVVGWLLVTSVSLAPVVVPLLLAAVAWRVARRRGHVPATVAIDGD